MTVCLESPAKSLSLRAMFRTGAQFMFLVLLAGLALMHGSRQEPLAAWVARVPWPNPGVPYRT